MAPNGGPSKFQHTVSRGNLNAYDHHSMYRPGEPAYADVVINEPDVDVLVTLTDSSRGTVIDAQHSHKCHFAWQPPGSYQGVTIRIQILDWGPRVTMSYTITFY